MKKYLSEEQLKEILAKLDKAIEEGPWEESGFLRVIGKNLRNVRENFANEVNLSLGLNVQPEHVFIPASELPTGFREVYISLYSFDGKSLPAWERVIANLPHQTTSRPIYAQESQVKANIRMKVNKENEGYVAIDIKDSDMLQLSEDKIPHDKLNVPLLSLKNKAILIENIKRFEHSSGTYPVKNGRLVIK